MATRKVFDDNNENSMSIYQNKNDNLYIEIGNKDLLVPGWIELDVDDIKELISDLESIFYQITDGRVD